MLYFNRQVLKYILLIEANCEGDNPYGIKKKSIMYLFEYNSEIRTYNQFYFYFFSVLLAFIAILLLSLMLMACVRVFCIYSYLFLMFFVLKFYLEL